MNSLPIPDPGREQPKCPPKPTAIPFNPSGIPDELKRKAQFVNWRFVWKADRQKYDKPPFDPKNGHFAKSNDPSTWGTFEQALQALPSFEGIGFVALDDIIVVDLDGCRNPESGEVAREAQEILRRFENTYIELSPSGRGFHILCLGESIPTKSKAYMTWSFSDGPRTGDKCEIEIWSHEQYVTLIGGTAVSAITNQSGALDWLKETYYSETAKSDQKILAKLTANESFRALHAGDLSAYDGDHSKADFAHLVLSCRYTQDSAQMDRLFRRSGLMRPKWDERRGHSTYGAETIRKVLASVAASKESEPVFVSINDLPSPREIGSAEIEWLFDGFIARGTLNGLVGPPAAGKTTLSHAIAYSVASGTPFAGIPCVQSDVLIEDLENPLPHVIGIQDRLGVKDCRVKFWAGWNEVPPDGPASASILKWIEQCPRPPFIIFDSWTAFFPGDNENDASQARKLILDFRRLTSLGATVLVLHHPGKSETAKKYRGSSYFEGGLDCGWTLENTGNGRLGILRLTSFKSRLTVGRDFAFKYVDGIFQPVDGKSAALQPGQNVRERLADLLQANPNISTSEFERIAVAQGIVRSEARRFVNDSVVLGTMQKEKVGKTYLLSWIGPPQQGSMDF